MGTRGSVAWWKVGSLGYVEEGEKTRMGLQGHTHLQGVVGTESWGGVNVEEGQAGEGSLQGHGKGHLGRGWWPWREWR